MQELDVRFNFHPATPETGPRHQAIRDAARVFAEALTEITGAASREQSLALTAIEEAMFWGNAAVAREAAREEQRRASALHAPACPVGSCVDAVGPHPAHPNGPAPAGSPYADDGGQR